jgi:mono/diheme cytochrome c family protein
MKRKTVCSVASTLAILLGSAVLVDRLMAQDANPDDWQVPARAARAKNPLTPDAQNIAVGKDLYAHQCTACHGRSGRGDGVEAKNLDLKPHDLTAASVAAQTDGALFWKIGEGHRPMPGFRQLVSDDERWHVICYVRTLAPPPASATQPATQP